MADSVNIQKKLYDSINNVAFHNPNEQMFILGANNISGIINVDRYSMKWFTDKELTYHDGETLTISENLLVRTIMDISSRGYDSIIMIHSHPGCTNAYDDFLYGSLSDEDIETSKKLLLICQFKNIGYYDGICTGRHIYFWSIDNENMIPRQLNCYVDGNLVRSRVPGTVEELIHVVRGKK